MVFLPTNDPDVRLFEDVSHRFGSLRVALVGVEAPPGDDVFSPASLGKIARATQAIKQRPRRRPRALADAVADIVSGPMGAEFDSLVPTVPPTRRAARRCATRCSRASSPSATSSRATAARALILAFLADPGKVQRQPGELRVEEQIRAAAERELAGMTIYFGGAPFAARAIYEEAQADVRHLSPVAMLVLLLVVILAFRDPVGVALTVGSVAFSVLVVIGGMGWCGEHFTVATSTLPVILFASGSSYAVHVLGRYYLLRASSARRPTPSSRR